MFFEKIFVFERPKGAGKENMEQIGRVFFNESDADVSRRRGVRVAVLIVSMASASFILGLLGAWIFGKSSLPGTGFLGFILGAGLGQWGFSFLSPRFFVSVPQAQTFVTLNPLLALFGIPGDPNIVYGPGLSVSFPWETRSRRSNLSLEVNTIPFIEEVPGDPVRLIVTTSYQFKINIRQAAKFVGVNESTIRGGVIDLIRSRVSQRLAGMDVNTAKAQIGDLNQGLGADFGVGSGTTVPSQDVLDFEERYGISSVAVTISGIDLPPDVQRTRDAADEAAQAVRSVASMFGMDEAALRAQISSGQITNAQYIEMLDRTLAQGGGATMNIQALKLGGLEALAEALARLFGQGPRIQKS